MAVAPLARRRRGQRRLPHPDRPARRAAHRSADAPCATTCSASARSIAEVAGVDEVLVSPRAHLLAMPTLGQGVLGRHLLALAQRLGPGDFHSLRDYVDGDEPRTIHWRASARSEELKVRQHSVEGLRRCLVAARPARAAPATAGEEGFERAVTAAASVVHSADRAGLTTRFVTTDGADLRGPDVAAQTLHLLARIDAEPDAAVPVERDPGEGLGLVVVISADARRGVACALERVADPTLHARRRVHDDAARPRTRCSPSTPAREASFLAGWDGWPAPAARRAAPATPRRRDAARSTAAVRTDDAALGEPTRRRVASTSRPRRPGAVLVRRRARVRPGVRRLGVRRRRAAIVVVGHGLSFLLRRLRVPGSSPSR